VNLHHRGAVLASPAVSNGVVYVGSENNNVYALRYTGVKVWNYPTGDAVLSSPAVTNGTVYVGSENNKVYALNATTGVKVWSFTTGGGFIHPRQSLTASCTSGARTTRSTP